MAAGLATYSPAFFSGIGGRVVMNGQIVVFIKEWSLEITTEIYGAPTFESPVAYGVAWDVKRFIGLSEAKVELNGYALNSGTTPLELAIGTMVSLQLYINADRGISISAYAIVQSMTYSQDAAGNTPAELKMTLQVNGAVSTPEG
jgi:hypothetical protein